MAVAAPVVGAGKAMSQWGTANVAPHAPLCQRHTQQGGDVRRGVEDAPIRCLGQSKKLERMIDTVDRPGRGVGQRQVEVPDHGTKRHGLDGVGEATSVILARAAGILGR